MNYRICRADCFRVGDTLYRPVLDVTIEKVTQNREHVTCVYTDGTSETFHWRDLLLVSCPHRKYRGIYI